MVYYKYAINKAKACYVGQDSSVGTASRYGLDDPGIESRWSEVSAPVQPYTRAHPSFYTTGKGLSPGVKRPRRGVCHPPPPFVPRFNAEQNYTSTPRGLHGLF